MHFATLTASREAVSRLGHRLNLDLDTIISKNAHVGADTAWCIPVPVAMGFSHIHREPAIWMTYMTIFKWQPSTKYSSLIKWTYGESITIS